MNSSEKATKKKRLPIIFYLLGLLFLFVMIAEVIRRLFVNGK